MGEYTQAPPAGVAAATSIPPAAVPGTAPEVLVADLLCGADILTQRLRHSLHEEQWLDAYLMAAGLSQLVEDRLHPDPLLLHRASSYLRGQPSRPARLAAAVAAGLGAVVRVATGPANRQLVRAQQALATLTVRLAGQVLAPQHIGDLTPLLRATLPAAPALAGDLMRLPACFHSFDQHPDDVQWLVREFRSRYPSRDRPLCVVGVRTSGSYLAPLHAAALRAEGECPVEVLSYRPGRPFLRRERARLKAIARAGGWVLIADDPPGVGTSLAATARAVAHAGVPDSRIVFLLSLFGSSDELPRLLRDWPAVVQPWAAWTVHGRLVPPAVSQALADVLGPGVEVHEARPLGVPCPSGERGHMRARFAVRMSDRHTGEELHRHILVEGAGLGYLGRQSVAVANALPGYVPHVHAFANGLLYRDWLPPAAEPVPASALADTVATYVTARRRALPAPSATVDRLGGRDPVWEVAAKALSGQYGRLAMPARPLLLEPLMRGLLTHEYPTVLDGKTDTRHWLPDPASGELRKVDFYQRAFGHLDLACYDPVFDLAGAAADPPTPRFEAQLREAYQRTTGEQVDGERWLLYRLAQLWRLGCANDLDADSVRQRSAAAIHDYLAALYLHGLPPATGPLCAIDLDGVLECDRLGYPATSPTGMRALRALIAHGYRPVLATGRSVPDVRDRCVAFGLAGGVAEYGAAVYHDGEAIDQRPPGTGAMLGQIRNELSGYPGVQADVRYHYAVRARLDAGPLPAELIAGIPALADPDVRIVQGQGQTDITVAGIDKGTGLRALAALLADPGCAFAIGDSPPDLPLLACAALARGPRNARLGTSGTAIKLTRRAYQAGLAEACAELLGHHPGACQTCRPPAFARRTRAVLALLDLRADGMASIPAGTAALCALTVRSPRW